MTLARSALPRCVVLGLALAASACQEEPRVVNFTPFFDGLEGAVGAKAVRDGVPAGGGAEGGESGQPADATASSDARPEDLVKTGPDGKKVIVSRTIRHVMIHLSTLLSEGDDDTLFNQLLADYTKAHFAAQGKDARTESLAYLKGNREDIMALFGRMPMAERSPGVMLEQSDGKLFRLALRGTAARGMRMSELWITMEKGQWKLVWVA